MFDFRLSYFDKLEIPSCSDLTWARFMLRFQEWHCQLDCISHSILCQCKYELYVGLVMCREYRIMLICRCKNFSWQKSLWNTTFIQILSQKSDPEAGWKHSKIEEQKKSLFFLRFLLQCLQLSSALYKALIKTLCKGSITCSWYSS